MAALVLGQGGPICGMLARRLSSTVAIWYSRPMSPATAKTLLGAGSTLAAGAGMLVPQLAPYREFLMLLSGVLGGSIIRSPGDLGSAKTATATLARAIKSGLLSPGDGDMLQAAPGQVDKALGVLRKAADK